jgi:hypothetical protein
MDLKGEVDVPGLGGVDKRVLVGVGAVAVGFVGWKWWQARSGAGAAAEAPVDPGMEDAGLLPGVAGAVRPDGDYGLPGGAEPNTDTYGFTGKTNSQWTQYAANQLVKSDRWSYTDIVEALGQFLADKPLSADQVAIVQAAVAVAGYPPVGSHVIIPGGNTAILVAPTGLAGTADSDTAVSLHWSAVAGASGYKVYRGTAEAATASTAAATVGGLTASTAYGFQVAAVAGGGQVGPKSSTVTVTTKAKASTPSTPTPSTPKPSTPSAPKYPTKWKSVINGPNSNYSSLAQKYGLRISGKELYDYQFTAQAGRPEATKTKLRKYGANLIYAAGSTVLPYPK